MKKEIILLDHGSGGKMAHRLISETLLPRFTNPILALLDDGAVFNLPEGRVAFSTDSYVVDPIFFPGGSIGDLAINGTVNDLAMCGAVPSYLSVGLIIEEGFPLSDLNAICQDMQNASRRARITVVTGDTKVVPKGSADKIFINTSGIGVIPNHVRLSGQNAKIGDRILVSGSIAEHGMAVLAKREGLEFDTPVVSDTACLNHLVARMLATEKEIHVLRDPTRGGVGTALNEIALASNVGIVIHEDRIPVKPEVRGICNLLGFDPLYVANEGRLIAFVPENACGAVLAAVLEDPLGKDACVIGEVTEAHPGRVILETVIGGSRFVDMLTGEQLPRIC
ncbi:MAG: hydrogenase expression/formation protein HypE [Deltaproteobacteria bacterium]|nr:hydrogenase expression/formation protein HypE [Deltaproteobacteria bacterium]MBW1956491.1 hydrogenase expression/formation protein HypE [Deltaproteobacteria bacterium]MBW2043016.1 hydrogenase expression/formation protein HypE [Deltaproteobacteria bacterium]MBW2133205.1 hydrogenase expression/formation protein HypE [Deltaproteobacteria bacterium]